MRLALHRHDKVSIGGIRLASMIEAKEQEENFARVTADALKLIRVHDPRRFRRIQHYVRCIVNEKLESGGAWNQAARDCMIDFSRCQVSHSQEHYLWYLARYAATIVHEATHAYVYSKYIAYNKRTRVRIERLCRLEQQRFARRFPRDQYDFTQLVPTFNEADWQPSLGCHTFGADQETK